jgi:hypothetical protein
MLVTGTVISFSSINFEDFIISTSFCGLLVYILLMLKEYNLAFFFHIYALKIVQ